MRTMISVKEAKDQIHEAIVPISLQIIPLEQSQGLVLAQDQFAPLNIPAYPQSSMDGYAIKWEAHRNRYLVVGEMAAGSNHQWTLQPGQASRIFTGAAVPEGADTVVMQEKTSRSGNELILQTIPSAAGENLRPVGSEIGKDELAMQSGTVLTPAAIGFLAGMGLSVIPVYPLPRVSIIVTGNELQTPGYPLGYGQVYESNSFTLLSALQQQGITGVKVHRSVDDLQQLTDLLQNALTDSDLVLMTGGVSVGDYDFTLSALKACGVNTYFHKVRQKPGKPVLFGMKNAIPVFGLPGNPASVLTCFYQYVLPAISRLMNRNLHLQTLEVPLSGQYAKAGTLTHFLKARFQNGKVSLLKGQESYKLNSFSIANCLAMMPEEQQQFNNGDLLTIHLLPL